MWFNGPYRPGIYSDLKLAQECGLHDVLDHDERYIADGTYQCNEAIRPDDVATHYETVYMKWCRSRHENINRLFKQFRVAKAVFERSVEKHGLFLHAIAQIVQLGIMIGQKTASFHVQGVQQPSSWPHSWEFRDENGNWIIY